MTMHLMEGAMIELNAQRTATDTVFVAAVSAMPWWLDMLHGPAQELAFWSTVMVALGRLIMFGLDVHSRLLGRSKPLLGERSDHDSAPRP